MKILRQIKNYCYLLITLFLTSCSVEPGQKTTIKNQTALEITLLEFSVDEVDEKLPLIVKSKSDTSFRYSISPSAVDFLIRYAESIYHGVADVDIYSEYTLSFSENDAGGIGCKLKNNAIALYKSKIQQITVENNTESDVFLLWLSRIDTDIKFPLLVESKNNFTTERYNFKSTYFEFQYKGQKYWGDPEHWENPTIVEISTLEAYTLRFFENNSGGIACDVFSGSEKIGSAKVEKTN